MKALKISRESHPGVFKGCRNLAQLVSWAESAGRQDDMVISKISLDGRFLDEDEENLLANLAISGIQELDVEYRPIFELVAETMKSLIALLQDLQLKSLNQSEAITEVSNLETNEIKEIFAKSRVLIHSLEEVFQIHNSGKFPLKHFSLWREAEKELTSILQCILQSCELKDAQLVSELLGSAFPDALMSWEDVLEKEILDNTSVATIFKLKFDGNSGDNEVDA